MRTDPLALIRGATEFVTVIYGPAVTFAFSDVELISADVKLIAPKLHIRSGRKWIAARTHERRSVVCKDIRADRMGEVPIRADRYAIVWEKWTEGTMRYSQSYGIEGPMTRQMAISKELLDSPR